MTAPIYDRRETRMRFGHELELEDPIREFRSLLFSICLKVWLFTVVVTVVTIALGLIIETVRAEDFERAERRRENLARNSFEEPENDPDSEKNLRALGRLVDFVLGGLMVSTVVGWILSGVLPICWAYWSMFAPKRVTDVLYLRSFKSDSDTWSLRVAIQHALGTRLRLSGIRDPRRREISFWDSWYPLLMAMKYCTPRYMDLEAETDWMARLWHSLQRGQGAILDLSTMTPYLADEIRLASAAVGLNRMVFIGHAPQTAEEISAIATTELELPSDTNLNILIWPAGGKTVSGTKEKVKEFRSKLRLLFAEIVAQPLPQKQTVPSLYGSVRHIPPSNRKCRRLLWKIISFQFISLCLFTVVGVFLGIVENNAKDTTEQTLDGVYALNPDRNAEAESVSEAKRVITWTTAIPLLLAGVNIWLVLQNWIIYIRDVGVPAERVKASLGLCVFMVLLCLGVWQILN